MVGQWQCTFTHAVRRVLHRASHIWRRVGETLHDGGIPHAALTGRGVMHFTNGAARTATDIDTPFACILTPKLWTGDIFGNHTIFEASFLTTPKGDFRLTNVTNVWEYPPKLKRYAKGNSGFFVPLNVVFYSSQSRLPFVTKCRTFKKRKKKLLVGNLFLRNREFQRRNAIA